MVATFVVAQARPTAPQLAMLVLRSTSQPSSAPDVGLLRLANPTLQVEVHTQSVHTYGVPTNVVTLCEVSVTVTRDCETLTAEPWPRLLLADVS